MKTFLFEHKELILWGWWIVMSVITALTLLRSEKKGKSTKLYWSRQPKGEPNWGLGLAMFFLAGAILKLLEFYIPSLQLGEWIAYSMVLLLCVVITLSQFFLLRYIVRHFVKRQKEKAATNNRDSLESQ